MIASVLRRVRARCRDWGWVITLAAGGGLLGCLGYHVSGLGDEASRSWATDFVYIPISVLAVVLCLRAARHRTLDGRIRRAWMIMAAACCCMVFGNVVWWWLDAVQGVVPPYPSLADAGFLLFMPLVFIALSTFPTPPQSRHERFKLLLDVGVVVVGGFMVLWYLVLGPTMATGGIRALGVATSIAYPVADLVLLWAVVTLLLRGTAPTCQRPLQILVASLVLHIVADIHVGYLGLHEGFIGGTWPDLFYLTSLYLLAVAAAEQYWRAGSTEGFTVARGRHSVNRLPYAAVGVSYLLLVLIASGQPFYPLGGLLLGAVTVTGLVVTRQIAALRDNEKLVVTDALTGLANRTRLRVALDRAMARGGTGAGALGVLMFDLDGFKEVNDTLGHETGDGLLVAFADVLRRCVRAGDTAARLGGDEFAVVLPALQGGSAAAVVVAERILTALREPIRIGEHTMTIRTSVGIALADDTGLDSVAELLHRADVAMYTAKRRGLHGYAVGGAPDGTRPVVDAVTRTR
jgi:diguanylate cyclase